jgi:hypothetical protein
MFAFKFASQSAQTPSAQASIQPTASPAPGAPPASGPLPPIKVGLVVSHATAVAQSPMGHPWGYQVQTRMAKELHAADVELYAVLEPGTTDADGMQEQLQQVFGGRPPIDGGDAEAIKQLKVVVTNENWVTTPELLKALDAAVSDGVGLVNNGGIGSVVPGVNSEDPAVTRLAGVSEMWFGQSQGAVACQVMSDHPLLGGLRDQAQIMLRIDGVYGVMPDGAVPLIKVVDMSTLRTYGKNTDDAQLCTFYPVYVSKLGKGRIISVQYAPWHRATVPPPQLGPRSNFFVRCVRWLVDRPVE